MAAELNMQAKADFIAARNIDFIGQFGRKITGLQKILSVMQVIPLPVGSVVKTYKSTVTMAGGAVAEGDVIPLSKVAFEPDKTYELAWDKRRKSVPGEEIQRRGFEGAITATDEQIINEQVKAIRNTLFTNLKTGTGTGTGVGLQAALAQAWGKLETAYEEEDFTSVAFVNPADMAKYLGKASITMQKEFGMTYIKNFLGFDVIFITSQVDAGTLIATAAENMVIYHAPVNGSDVSQAFELSTDPAYDLVGVKHFVSDKDFTYQTLSVAAILWLAEKLDGIFKVTITDPAV